MQRIDMANFIGAKVGQLDSTSIGIINTFLQRRYQMIYDQYAWRDSITNVTMAIAAGETSSAFPGGIERIKAIAIASSPRFTVLTPIDSAQALRLNPAILDTSSAGEISGYEDFSDDDGVRMIRWFPAPNSDTTLLVTGKRTLTNLTSDTATPVLRNIDNALIAYATGDMLERQRQYGKAQAKFSEGASLLQEMIAIETSQGANVPRIIPDVEPGYFEAGSDDWFLAKSSF